MAVRESSPGRGKTTYNTPSVFTRLDTLETEVGGIVVPDVTGKADKTYVDSQDGVLSAQLADIMSYLIDIDAGYFTDLSSTLTDIDGGAFL